MKLKMRVLVAVLLVCAVAVLAGCSPEPTPYERNDADGYTVSVTYDANGGIFTTNTAVMVSAYNPAEMEADSDGNVHIPLLAPDDAARGNDAFTAARNGYFLAGWYAQRNESTDADGNTVYTYAQPWDFETDRLTVDTAKTYTSQESVLTLYAAWVPLFEVQFYTLDTQEELGSYTYNPLTESQIKVPAWDMESGELEMYRFPKRSGYTFAGAYYDAQATMPVDTETLNHPGTLDIATGTAQDPVMKVFVDWTEGEWYHIYTAEQFLKNASVNGSYVIHADLDFTDEIWPTSLMHGNFSGTIQGNGHTFSNITVRQTNNSKVNSGLFGYLTEQAQLLDLKLHNVTFTVEGGTRVAGATFGVLAGTVSDQAVLQGVNITASRLCIDSDCYFGTEDYVIGLVSGIGVPTGVDAWEITCEATGENPEKLAITTADNAVTVAFITE